MKINVFFEYQVIVFDTELLDICLSYLKVVLGKKTQKRSLNIN